MCHQILFPVSVLFFLPFFPDQKFDKFNKKIRKISLICTKRKKNPKFSQFICRKITKFRHKNYIFLNFF